MLNPDVYLLAVVVIGRNEGERLQTCLASVKKSRLVSLIVYIDSGSTDGSVELAVAMGCKVLRLDMSLPFSAARARNEGALEVQSQFPDVRYLQFVDGDCEVVEDWLSVATEFLEAHGDVAAVCGRRRERFPESSVFNRLCDVEWNTPVGQARSCGGDVLMRASAFYAVGGYRSSLIAGEEPELCVRLRAKGWRIWRLPAEMTLHDAAMHRVGQWWNRSKRAGYAFAEGSYLHGAAPERHYFKETQRAIAWGGLLPAIILVSGLLKPAYFVLLLLYPLQIVRIARQSSDLPGGVVWTRAFFLVLAKFPECLGVLRFWKNRVLGKAGTLIEYK